MNKRLPARLLAWGLLPLCLAACLRTRPHAAPTLPDAPVRACFKVSPFAVAPGDQDSTQRYFLNHPVLATLAPDPADQTRLKTALSDPKNYIDGLARACEFLPSYGIALEGADLLLSAAPCPKVLWHNAAKDTIWDLSGENGVLPLLAGMQWE